MSSGHCSTLQYDICGTDARLKSKFIKYQKCIEVGMADKVKVLDTRS